MRNLFKGILIVVLSIVITFANLGNISAVQEQTEETTPIDILFIGNSMTYYNTLCDVVEGLAEKAGYVTNCTEVTVGGSTLKYHMNSETTLKVIKKGGYEVVILQDIVGSFNGDDLIEGANSLVPIIRKYNPDVQIVFYEPWPVKSTVKGEYNLTSYFTENYVKTAKTHNAMLAPAGETFYDIYVNHGLDFYCLDEKHPQPLGTFVSAATIYATLFDEEIILYEEDQEWIDKVINENVAYTEEGKRETYNLDTLNLILERGRYYANSVKDAVAGNGEYISIAGKYKDPDEGQNPNNLPIITGQTVHNKFFAKKEGNLALGCKAYGTTEKKVADFVVDGNLSTRWESEFCDPQGICVDLGSSKQIKTVGFMWEAAYAKKYYIQISNDGINWSTVAVVSASYKKTEKITLDKTYKARYVRMFGTKRGTSYGYSIWEMAVWGPEQAFVTVNNTKIRSAVKKKKSRTAKVVLRKVKEATRYQILIANNKKFKKSRIKTYKKNVITIKKLRKNTKYYIKARVYKKVNGKKYYSKWTGRKMIKMKK